MSECGLQDALSPAPLDTLVVGSRVLLFEEVGSTNERALELGGDGTVIVADRQTAGRGRHGRTWSSEAGLGLWFSVALKGPADGLPFAAALAVRDALRRHCTPSGCRVSVKWPNDVLLNGGKVCGILVESRDSQSVIGIGLNVCHKRNDFPEAVRDRATSLKLETGLHVARREILRDVLLALDERISALRSPRREALWREWREACGIRGCSVSYGGCQGIVLDLDESGALVLDTPDGVRRVSFGDVVEVESA